MSASAWKLPATSGGGGSEKAPPGNHPAVLVGMVDLGTQWVNGFQGAEGRWARKGYFVWELVGEPVAGQPSRNHLVGCDLTMSNNEKATLRKWVEARTGRKLPDGAPLDLEAELGQPCLLNVVANAKGYPKVDGLTALPRGMSAPPAKTAPFAWPLLPPPPGSPPAAWAKWRADLPARLADLPGWLPWHYGKPLSEHVLSCREMNQIGRAHV